MKRNGEGREEKGPPLRFGGFNLAHIVTSRAQGFFGPPRIRFGRRPLKRLSSVRMVSHSSGLRESVPIDETVPPPHFVR